MASPDESILITIKKMLGIAADDSSFNLDIVNLINSALFKLDQLGVLKTKAYIFNGDEKWGSLDLVSTVDINDIVAYIYLETKITFDVPSSSYALKSYQETAKELEWRLNTQAEEEVVKIAGTDSSASRCEGDEMGCNNSKGTT